MKFNIKISLLILAAMLLLIATYFFLSNRSGLVSNPSPTNKSTPTTNTTDNSRFLNPTNDTNKNGNAFSIPSKDAPKMTLQIKGEKIETNNLYKNPVERFSDNSVAFVENKDYHMSFYPQNQGLLITLLNPDIQKARDMAEADLLSSLGITKDQACKLTVELGMPIWVNEKAAGKNYGLSFCPNGKVFPK